MKVYLSFTLILILGFSAFGQIQLDPGANKDTFPGIKKDIAIVYDQLNNRSQVTSPWFSINHKKVYSGLAIPVTFAANFGFTGREIQSPAEEFTLLFNYSARSWMFMLHHKLTFQVDGETIDLGDGNYQNKPTGTGKNSGVSESMRFSAKREYFEKIANGKQVELQLGAVISDLRTEHKEMFKELLSLSKGK
jgi:hypothetical protein